MTIITDAVVAVLAVIAVIILVVAASIVTLVLCDADMRVGARARRRQSVLSGGPSLTFLILIGAKTCRLCHGGVIPCVRRRGLFQIELVAR